MHAGLAKPHEKMGKYSFDPDQAVESSKARGSALRALFKLCGAVARGWRMGGQACTRAPTMIRDKQGPRAATRE